MLKVAYGECIVSQKSVYKWYKLFTEGREEVNDDTQPGRPRQCSQNVDVNGPTMDPTSSWLLPRSTAIGWLNEEDTMSSKHLWWGPFTSTFCEHWAQHVDNQ